VHPGGLLEALHLAQHDAEVVRRVRVVRTQLERAPVGVDRIHRSAHLLQDIAEVVHRVDVVGPQLDRAAHELDGLQRLALLVAQHTEEMQRAGVARVLGEDRGVDLLGLLEPPLLVQRDARRERCVHCASPTRCASPGLFCLYFTPRRARRRKRAS
jgi:hypothetical protein